MKKFLKNIKKISALITFSLIVFSSAAGFVFASDNNIEYVPLAPLPGTTKGQCSGSSNPLDMLAGSNDCTTDFSTYLPGAFNFVVGLSAVLAFVVLTYGGVLYMTSDAISKKSEGKKYIENALWGLGLVLASYVILYTINPQILSFRLKLVQPETSNQSSDILSAIIKGSSWQPGETASGAYLLSGSSLAADQSVRSLLTSDGIGINHGPCSATVTSNCTNLNGLQDSTINALGYLQSAVCTGQSGSQCSSSCASAGNCDITVTGGTEAPLHNAGTSHANGSSVDLAATPDLNAYLAKNGITPGKGGSLNGMTFTYETIGSTPATNGTHWHVSVP